MCSVEADDDHRCYELEHIEGQVEDLADWDIPPLKLSLDHIVLMPVDHRALDLASGCWAPLTQRGRRFEMEPGGLRQQ